MALEAVDTAPNLDDFTLLSQHQEQTPGTFFGGKPVLHLHAPDATFQVPRHQFTAQPDLQRLSRDNASPPGNHDADDAQIHISNVDVWVTSKHILFYSRSIPRPAGLRILYPSITVTAQDGHDVLLELNLSDADTADEDIEFVQLRITPGRVGHHAEPASAGTGANGTTRLNDASTALFKAISDCQELNPDPVVLEDGEDGDGEALDETAPGASGWITSENMADFMDEDGNFRMPAGMPVLGDAGGDEAEMNDNSTGTQEPLGEGAGRTRTAAEALEEEETKWQRTG